MELSYKISPAASVTSTRAPWASSSRAMVCSTPSRVSVSDTARVDPITRACRFRVLSLEVNTMFWAMSTG